MFRLSPNKLILALAASIISSLSTTALAQEERWFEVEIYLFEHNTNTVEQWPETAIKSRHRKTVDFITPLISTDLTALNMGLNGCTSTDWATDSLNCNEQLKPTNQVKAKAAVPMTVAATEPATAYLGEGPVLLAESQSQFNDIIATLKKEQGHNSLLHMAWQQSMVPRNQAIPVKLFTGHDYADKYEPNGQPLQVRNLTDQLPQFDFMSSGLLAQPKQPVWKFDGTINIYLEHYLFIETAFNLREEGQKTMTLTQHDTTDINGNQLTTQNESVTSPFLYSIAMQQNRRVRSNEVHYFDHPKMGMIIQIRKMQHPSIKTEMQKIETVSSIDEASIFLN
ncbi:peptidoglycan binding protein CsiV [Shewanella youngdeokensis]|uniref:Peptidoglycan binding protein CsiV n=1 Tax=Shewanella youngdeokensis TaxID=2999068 RepID=A0ABZ0K3R1_9GAMM|nr:peptidoglycan binding protein CsiV [Shewanella sp. DAU334]